jgi:hypothetical protein
MSRNCTITYLVLYFVSDVICVEISNIPTSAVVRQLRQLGLAHDY